MPEARKQKQWLILGIAAAALLLIILVLGQVMNARRATFQGIGGSGHVDETIIADRTSQASPELTWARQSREEIERLSRTVSELTASVTALTESQKTEIEALREQYDEVIVTQQAEINALKEGVSSGPSTPVPPGAVLGPNGENFGQEFITGGGRTAAPGRAGEPAAEGGVLPFGNGFAIDFTLKPMPAPPVEAPDERSARAHDLSAYIPAGSYAPAVVISGVDASTGVVSRDNPVPVLVRITGPAVTAAGGAGSGRRINITGCTVLGSAMGDLSSERVYVRLTTLTCLGKGNQVIETQVAGLVAGSGKAGVRGQVVSREGNLAMNAAIAGALGGFADAVSSAASIASSNDSAESVGSVLAGAGTGMLGGAAGNAADRLAEYYIKRAEQYQPVVSLYAGTEVEVVFMEGVSLK